MGEIDQLLAGNDAIGALEIRFSIRRRGAATQHSAHCADQQEMNS
jgi:hypothetical protein